MGLSRRKFLKNSLALGCSIAANPFVTPVTFATAPTDNRLVVLILRGGMDGLASVSPIGDPNLAGYRPSFDLSGHADLDGFYGLHPKLGDLMPLWTAGELAFGHALSTPYRNKRSHFDGQDMLEAGAEEVSIRMRNSGWMNRMLTLLPGARQETAFSVGREDLLLMRGEAPITSWSPAGRIDMSPQAQLLLDTIYQKDPLFAEAGQTAMTLAMQMNGTAPTDDQMQGAMMGEDEPAMMAQLNKNIKEAARSQKVGDLAGFAAGRLREDTRIAAFSLGGWDTHYKQDKAIRKAMQQLSEALLTLKAELGPVWAKTTVICMTEFGRTVRENGSGGTDHGTGGATIFAGGAVRGGKVYTDWPGLAENALYQGRDLMPTSDVRRYAAWAMHGLFGLARSDLETTVFPGLDMGMDPKFIL